VEPFRGFGLSKNEHVPPLARASSRGNLPDYTGMQIASQRYMQRSWKCIFVARVVAMLVISGEAQAADIEPGDGRFTPYTPAATVSPQPPAPVPGSQAWPQRSPALKLDDSEPQFHWYGYQILISDAVTSALLLVALKEGSVKPLYPAAVTWLLVPPIIHSVNGQTRNMPKSFLIRLLLPSFAGFLGFVIGITAQSYGSSGEPSVIPAEFIFGGLGVVLGAIAASVIDTSHYAYEPIKSPAPISMAVLPNQHGATLSLAATF